MVLPPLQESKPSLKYELEDRKEVPEKKVTLRFVDEYIEKKCFAKDGLQAKLISQIVYKLKSFCLITRSELEGCLYPIYLPSPDNEYSILDSFQHYEQMREFKFHDSRRII